MPNGPTMKADVIMIIIVPCRPTSEMYWPAGHACSVGRAGAQFATRGALDGSRRSAAGHPGPPGVWPTHDAAILRSGRSRVRGLCSDLRGRRHCARRRQTWARRELLVQAQLALLIHPHTDSVRSDPPGNSRGRYAMEIVDFLGSKGYEARHIHQGDGRIDGVVDQHALPRIPQNLINIAFVRPELRSRRPELFRT